MTNSNVVPESYWRELSLRNARGGGGRSSGIGAGQDGRSQLARGRHRLEHTGDELAGAFALDRIGLAFEEFRVRENDPQLVVQPMKQTAEIRRARHSRRSEGAARAAPEGFMPGATP